MRCFTTSDIYPSARTKGTAVANSLRTIKTTSLKGSNGVVFRDLARRAALAVEDKKQIHAQGNLIQIPNIPPSPREFRFPTQEVT
jgi:hypothetical protein